MRLEGATTIELRDVPRRAQVAVFAAAALLYLLTFSVGSDGILLGNDVVPYARTLVDGGAADLLNPHHLAFHPLAALVARVLALAGEPGIEDALRAQKLLSALGGATACLFVFRWAAGLAGPLLGAWVTGLFGLSAGTWLYASVGETYLPATAAVAGLLAHTASRRIVGRSPRLGPTTAWLLAALLLRQDSILVLPALWLLAGVRVGFAATLLAGLGALGASAAAWGLADSGTGLWTWLRGLEQTGFWGGGVDGDDVVRSLNVLGLALLFVRLAAPFFVFVQATWLLAGAGLIPFRSLDRSGRRVMFALLLFALVRTAFFTWWQPGNLEFHAGTLLPLALVAGLALGPAPRMMARIVRTLPQLGSLALVASGNAMMLVLPNQASDVAERAVQVLDWAGASGGAEEAGLVVALDRLQFYALQRVPSAERGGVELVDASDAVSGIDPASASVARAAIDRHLSSGKPVVVVRDVVLVQRLGFPEWPIGGYEALVDGLVPVAVEDEDGRRWADILRRGNGP